MFHAALWTLRQRRYAALAAFMLVVAVGCAAAGTFELHRYREKRHDNGVLRANAHRSATPLTTALVPLVGGGPAPDAAAIRYRTVTVTGSYRPSAQQYVDDQSQGGRQGFYVLTPLGTAHGTLLVVRGFVPATATETRPAQVAAPPGGVVRVTGRLQTAQTSDDQQGRLGHEEITAINPAAQAVRLRAPTYQAYVTLDAGQPGTSGLRAVPKPDLANPTGGAAEWQLFSYIVQWYVFALLALAAPFLFARSEVREARRRFLGEGVAEIDADQPELPELDAGAAPAGALVVRESGVVDRVSLERWQRAARLADRYGRSLGPGAGPQTVVLGKRGAPWSVVRDSSAVPHRSDDAYHGSYNDYLWELALADGQIPDISAPPSATDEPDPPDDRG